jgi:microsomal dipeptidase-like Zn-dependent dipeptidase
MLADMHCHFPMHLVATEEEHPHDRVLHWWDQLVDDAKGEAFELVAKIANDEAFGSGWRVTLDGLIAGGTGLVCSVLYWPFCEFQLKSLRGGPPDADAFGYLLSQLEDVEQALAQSDPEGSRHAVVRTETDLNGLGDSRLRFVHCIEGGFHLGPDPDAVADQIARLADRGVFYITLAHLLYRGVAANAPALPMFSDEQYNAIFDQPVEGLPQLGRAAVGAMCEHSVVVDLSHMRRDAIAETLDELDRLDPHRTMPVIASHVGAASAGPRDHAYNLEPETMRRLRDREGVIGIIMAQHLLGDTKTPDESRELLRRHIMAVRDAVGDHGHTAIGTDLDGFISPTLAGIEKAEDLATLEQWIREIAPDDAEAILHRNAERVIRAALHRRGASGDAQAPSGPMAAEHDRPAPDSPR